ncbi:MAG: SUMF1/EgtB/PvdO family nonheme iron enzyme [Rhodoferax sp.]|uniref:SUMF1/EgtB/PvdO family nonheme iron enzyme n=1 Tax=Rhodoferax sp. TaxID=50421 RepID=UPI0026052021|nr:SUMF1/EgtB/PvdO family nonheme iron enzyme [Rhodoferax sp.]MDD2882847.1 SUMF1/EgtB/PvdO family nonheme iron enzyme [Rhodoferax sp.]
MNINLTPDELNVRYALLCRSTQVEAVNTPQAQQNEIHLQALNKLLNNDLRALARQGSPDDFADIYFALEQELERFREFCAYPALAQKFVVAFGGSFSAGKSSLINTLLGQRLLVTEVDPTTSLPTYVLKGDADAVHALNLFGHRMDLGTDDFLSLTHDEVQLYGSNISRLLRTAIMTRADFPWNNLAIIDTPGYTKHEDQTQGARTDEHIARTQLNAAQAIVWVIDARQGVITEDDLKFLASLQPDIPRLIAVSRADQKPAQDVASIVATIKRTLTERNVAFVDVLPVSARNKPEWPVQALLEQLATWNTQPRALRFAHNFKALFTRYADFIEQEQRQAQRHLNRLNRILIMADSEDVQADAQELKQHAEKALSTAKEHAIELLDLRQRFFGQLKSVGDTVGIALPEPAEIDLLDNEGVSLLELFIEQRTQQGQSAPDEPETLRSLMLGSVCTKLTSLIGNDIESQLNPHFASTLDVHSRETYARLLAALLIANGAVEVAQSQLFKILLVTLGLGDIRAKLFAQAKTLNQDELKECRRIILEHGLVSTCLVDALVLCRLSKPLNEFQTQLFSELANYLAIASDQEIQSIAVATYVMGLNKKDECIEGDMTSHEGWGSFIPLSGTDVCIKIAQRKKLPVEVQLELAKNTEQTVVVALASNKGLAEIAQTELTKNGSVDVLVAIAKNPCLTESIQNHLFNTGNAKVKASLATNVSLVIDIKRKLSQDSDLDIKMALAENISIENEIIAILEIDKDARVRAALAKNSALTGDQQIKISKDELKVRVGLAGNTSLLVSLQTEFVSDSNDAVRIALARNPVIDEVIQAKLVQDRRVDVRESLATNVALCVAQQFQLFDRSDIDVTIELFKNPSLNGNLREKIISSVSDYQLESARDNSNDKERESERAWKEYWAASKKAREYQMKYRDFFFSQSQADSYNETADDLDREHSQASRESSLARKRYAGVKSIVEARISKTQAPIVQAPIVQAPIVQAPITQPPLQKAPTPGDILQDGPDLPTLVVLPGGHFQMGSNAWSNSQPIHTVQIKSFAMGQYPVTQRQWLAVMGDNPSRFTGDEARPVESVSWDDVQRFIEKLNAQTGHTYRLPSEAEWEYACRAGSTGKWCFGDDEKQLGQYAWYKDNSGDQIHPVGQLNANAFGLHDVHGNVWEWCHDTWHESYNGAPCDGTAWISGDQQDKRLARGGSSYDISGGALAACRNKGSSGGRVNRVGFRLARTLAPLDQSHQSDDDQANKVKASITQARAGGVVRWQLPDGQP